MADGSKTVFISYRRSTSSAWARAVLQDLQAHGYDVFMDVKSLPSGEFGPHIQKEIAERAHFLPILTPKSVERCQNPDDWMRREIEHALRLKRNIVPLLVDGFRFENARAYLTGKLAELENYNALTLDNEHFDATMERLQDQFLQKVVPPAPVESQSLIRPAEGDELLIVIARFRGPEDIDPQDYIAGRLEGDLPAHPTLAGRVRVACYPKVIEAESRAAETERAKELAEELGATLVIWGVHDRYHIRAHYVVGRNVSVRDLVPLGEQRVVPSQLDDFVLYVQTGLPQAITYLSLFTIGQMHYFAEQWDEAEELFSAALQCAPEGEDYAESGVALRFCRGYAYWHKGDYEQAIADYTEAIRLKPNYAEAFNNRGVVYENMGQPDQAIADYTEAIRLKHDLAKSYCNRGDVSSERNEFEQAIADYTEAIRLKPDDVDAYLNRGNAYWYKGDYEQAIVDCTEAIRLQPDDAAAYYNRALAYWHKGDYERAIADYTEAIRFQPDDAATYIARGYAHDDMGEYDQAIADYTEAIRLNPNLAGAYSNRGAAYASQGNYDQAIVDYTKAIRLQPDNAAVYTARGIAYVVLGSDGQAIVDFTEAIQIQPDLVEAHICRGAMHIIRSCYEQAIADYTEAIRLKSDYAAAYNGRGKAYWHKGNYEEAIKDWAETIRLKPDDVAAHHSFSVVLLILGQSKTGAQRETLLRWALEVTMREEELEEGVGTYNIACFHCLLGEKAQALAWLEKALAARPVPTREHILQDTDLAALRDSAKFRRLLERYRPE